MKCFDFCMRMSAAVLCGVLLGCSQSEPSLSEIEQGMIRESLFQAGGDAYDFGATATKVTDKAWTVRITYRKDGNSYEVYGTATMNSKGKMCYIPDFLTKKIFPLGRGGKDKGKE